MDRPYNPNFRDELVLTAGVMVLMITGSFFFAWRATKTKNSTPEISIENEEQVLGTTEILIDEVEKTISETGLTSTPTPKSTPSPTPQASSSAIPTPQYDGTIIEQPYGSGGEYDNDFYKLTISNPRLIVSTSRTFKVEVVLANKSVNEGLKNRISATIIKDGNVIAESAPFSLSESVTVYPGEQITFTAKMSLISGTDVSAVKYLPLSDEITDTIHNL